MLVPSKLFILVLLSNIIHYIDGVESNEPIKESPLNFDIDAKKKAPLPSCQFSFQYDLARAIVSALCFIIAAFVLVFGNFLILLFFNCYFNLNYKIIFTRSFIHLLIDYNLL